jgi:hypothetical protein
VPAAGRQPPRLLAFIAFAALCLAIAGGYVVWSAQRSGIPGPATRSGPAPAANNGAALPDVPALQTLQAAPHVLFRSTALDNTYGQVLIAALPAQGATGGQRLTTGLECERVDAAAGQGLCLAADRGVLTTYRAILFGPDLRPRHTLPLGGLPSRARLSPDGRYAAMTVFVSGHSYADVGFSTETIIVEVASGESLGNLETYTVMREGAPISSPDFNFWGVTFARDSNRFYATLGTAGKTYLVEGEIAARRVRVLREGVECPSLSPDSTRIAFKKQVGAGGRIHWQIAILDLRTQAETQLTREERSVDDQVEWLDDAHVLYGLPEQTVPATPSTSVWRLAVDGGAPPQRFLATAWSPAVSG